MSRGAPFSLWSAAVAAAFFLFFARNHGNETKKEKTKAAVTVALQRRLACGAQSRSNSTC
jgi:hypothetical protein